MTKNVGFIRWGMPTELDLSRASVNMLGTELRVGILKALLNKGNRVTIYTGMNKYNKDLIKTKNLFEANYWTNNINYNPLGLPNDEDALFIEMGQSNTLYDYEENGKVINYMRRTYELIDSFEGKVIYYQHGLIPFRFKKAKVSKSDSDKNLTNMLNGKDLFKNKNSVILHHCLNEEAMKKFFKGYEKLPLTYKYIPLGYSIEDPFFLVKEKPEYDAMFIGSDKTSASAHLGLFRYEEAEKFYSTQKYRSAIIGKWNEWSKTPELTYLGQKGKHGDAYKFYNNAYLSINIQTKAVEEIGLVPSRLVIAIRGGSVSLATDEKYGEVLGGNDFIVKNSDEVKELLARVKEMSIEEREKLRRLQLGRFPKWEEIPWWDILKGG
jgi:hypothetical protein